MGKILFIRAGGTIEQKKNSEGVLVPSSDDFFYLLPEVNEKYDFDKKYLGSFDSTEITLDKRKEIAKTVHDNYDNYEGFLITHGTDTMANTASALNYMLQNSSKPIVITGSQIPIYDKNTDAIRNVSDSFIVANSDMNGSMIVFDSKIIKGVRSSKINANKFSAFDSSKVPYLGKVRSNKISLDGFYSADIVDESKGLKYFDDFSRGVVLFQSQSSGVSSSVLEGIVENESVPGLIFSGYGVGNVEKRFQNALKKASDLGKPVGLVTSCFRGSTNAGTYESGNWLSDYGVFELQDMTPEAAVQKMMYSIGMGKSEGKSGVALVDSVKEIMLTPIGGDFVNWKD